MNEQRPPTVKDIAAHTGLSFSTVARILRGEKRFRPETVETVSRAAEALGYRSNRAAAILASRSPSHLNRRESLAYISLETHLSTAWKIYRQTALDYAETRGFHCTSLEVDDLSQLPRNLDKLYHQGVDGLIFSRIRPGIGWADLELDRFSVVGVARADEVLPVSTVRPDVSHSVRVCFEKLREVGCRRIGAALRRHQEVYLDDRDRCGAYLDCWRRAFPGEQAPRIYDELHRDFTGLEEWLRAERIDGLISFSSADYQTLTNRGWKIPGDLRVAALLVNSASPPGLAGVEEEQRHIHLLSVDLLDHKLRMRERGMEKVRVDYLITPTWREGASCS
ncbi:MAG: LacI family DNA-binding transcriptional regulator [Opitutales bacterium]